MQAADPREITIVIDSRGRSLFEAWYESIEDKVVRRKILVALSRLADVNFQNFKSIGRGVFEYRIHFGAGYRIYFGMRGDKLVILLTGGDKSSQRRDIYEAQKRWNSIKAESTRLTRKLSAFRP